jgi:fumarylacetoacetate (FAA) hydrolase
MEASLQNIASRLNAGTWEETLPVDQLSFKAPLPRTWSLLDGSAFIQHVILVRKARGAEPPADLFSVPLMYQGISDNLLGANDPIPLLDSTFGLDFESEIAIITDHVPQGTKACDAASHIKLILLMNDITLRELIPRELATGFGFFHSKPASSFSPFAVTPEELGDAWRDGRVHLPLFTYLNGTLFGSPSAGEMYFSFFDLIEHAAKTRHLSPGTIIGSGTVSNENRSTGSSCIVEKRMLEIIETGSATTRYLKPDDTLEITTLLNGRNLFGSIIQRVVQV